MAKARKKVQARRKPAGRKAAARRVVKAKTAKRAKARPKQKFTVSHHREEDFDQGLRPYSAYRDLGFFEDLPVQLIVDLCKQLRLIQSVPGLAEFLLLISDGFAEQESDSRKVLTGTGGYDHKLFVALI